MDAIREHVRSIVAGTWAEKLPRGMVCIQLNEKDKKGRYKVRELKPGDSIPDNVRAYGGGGWTETDELVTIHIDYDVGHGRPEDSYGSTEEALQAALTVRAFVGGASEERYSTGGQGLHQRIFIRSGSITKDARKCAGRIAKWLQVQCGIRCDLSVLGRQNLWFWSKNPSERTFQLINAADGEWTVPEEALKYDGKKQKAKKQSQAALLIELLGEPQYVRDGERFYVRTKVNDHCEVVEVPSDRMRLLLSKLFYDKFKSTCRPSVLTEACNTLAARARFEGQARAVHFKVAMDSGRLYIDLFNDRWQVAEISRTGWQILNDSPVLFHRNGQAQPLPTPVPGGSLDELKEVINIGSNENWILLCAWILGAFHPTGPYPILFVSGQHGSAKSTLCRFVKQLIDPQEVEDRFAPVDARDVILAAYNSYVLAFDNLSSISKPMSDVLCKLSTGGGFSKRKHYCDTDEVCIKVKRPVILNSIEDVISQSDLADRAICIQVPVVGNDGRRLESELQKQFSELHPKLLGAVFTVLSSVLEHHESVSREGLPRMADFAAWAIAGEKALGFETGSFLAAYNRCSEAYSASLIEGNAVCDAIRRMVGTGTGTWSGTCTELLSTLSKKIPYGQLSTLPKSPRALRNLLNRLVPNFTNCGIAFEFGHTGTERRVTIVNRALANGANQNSVVAQLPQATFVYKKPKLDAGANDDLAFLSAGS